MKSVGEIKKFVEWRDRSGNLSYTFGEAFGVDDKVLESITAPVEINMNILNDKVLNDHVSSIGVAINILDKVIGVSDYDSATLLRLSVAIFHLQCGISDKLIKEAKKYVNVVPLRSA